MFREYKCDKFTIYTDRKKVDPEAVCSFLSKSYWANTRNKDTILRSIENSLCFSLFKEDTQIGFARLVTDYATFAYLCDVYIDENYRGLGLGKWLMECIVDHDEIKGIKKMMLATSTAHGLYKKYGFDTISNPELYMILTRQI
ncbi:MAG: GNAT family N-acetyltransferase [Clostridiaceae bacterium]|nr:GNAT family N-acetyltransferase [Clostridiaceae bacterium]